MLFAKSKNVKDPIRGTDVAAGIDLFTPEFDENFISDFIEKNEDRFAEGKASICGDTITLEPHTRALIPSGIYINLRTIEGCVFDKHHGIMLQVNNKSGVSSKTGLTLLANIIDEDYQGEIYISVLNTTNEELILTQNTKITQIIAVPVLYTTLEETKMDKLFDGFDSERGNGAFGSTGV